MNIFIIESVIWALVGIIVFAINAWALFNAVRFPAEVYQATFKSRDKKFWVLLCVIAFFIGILMLPVAPFPGASRMLFFGMIGVTISGVFLADMYPALKLVRRP